MTVSRAEPDACTGAMREDGARLEMRGGLNKLQVSKAWAEAGSSTVYEADTRDGVWDWDLYGGQLGN